MGSTGRARGSSQAAAGDRQSGRGLEGQVRTDTAVMGSTGRARGSSQAAATEHLIVCHTTSPPTAITTCFLYILFHIECDLLAGILDCASREGGRPAPATGL